MNSRNPYARSRAPYQARNIGGNLSGPIVKKKSSFFIDFERRGSDDNAIINAPFITLAAPFDLTRVNRTVVTPRTHLSINPRIDYQLNTSNTLVARYSYERTTQDNLGVSETSLDLDPFFNLDRTYSLTDTEHAIMLTETAILSPTVINETRFRFAHNPRTSGGDISRPVIAVRDAFTAGGSSAGPVSVTTNRFELQNYTSFTRGTHSMKAGVRIRGVRLTDSSQQNFNGTFVFAGQQSVLSASGAVLVPGVSSLDQFRAFLAGDTSVLPTQLTIAGGNPEAFVSQTDFGLFWQDDWRLRPNFTVSAGLRYENQTNISSNLNFAPRLSFAWSPGAAGRQPKTVLRGGLGVFYDRAGESLTLQENRFNGTNQQQFFIIERPLPFVCGAAGAPTTGCATADQVASIAQQNAVARSILGQFRGIFNGTQALLSIADLTAFRVAQTTRRVADELEAPYTVQSVFSVERLLPGKITATVNYINTRSLHLLRSRNINAPLNGVRPLGDVAGNIYQFESSGVLNQNQLVISANTRFNPNFTIFSNYTLSKTRSNSDGANSFPANSYDLSGEYGRASIDVRHRLFFGGSFTMPFWDLRLNPFIIATSGRPFNITTGQDANGDTLFTERPAFADAQTPACTNANPLSCDLRTTPFGNFDIRPKAGQTIIPRNYGQFPGIFTVNLRVSKTFSFGNVGGRTQVAANNQQGSTTAAQGAAGNRGGGRPAQGGARGGSSSPSGPFGAGGVFGGGGGPRGGGGPAAMFGGAGGRAEKRYNMTLSLNFNNLFNHTNPGIIVGNLSSPDFGRTISTGGAFGGGGRCPNNRCVEAQVRFSF